GMRHDHCLRQARFCGRIGVFDYGDAPDRRAAFRSDLNAGHIATLDLESRTVAVITAASARQKRFVVGKAQLVLSRSETVEPEIALPIRLGVSTEPAKSYAIERYDVVGAFGFDTDHTGARNRLACLVINDAAHRFVSLLCDAEPDVNAGDFAASGDFYNFRLIFICGVGMPGARVFARGPGH